jgi:hypothetical protein
MNFDFFKELKSVRLFEKHRKDNHFCQITQFSKNNPDYREI